MDAKGTKNQPLQLPNESNGCYKTCSPTIEKERAIGH